MKKIEMKIYDEVETLDGYQYLASRTISRDLKLDAIKSHALHGMASEIGEVHGLYQKTYQGHQLDENHVKSELGDLLWFIAEFCSANGWKLSDVANRNIEKLIARYPNGFEAEKSLKRKEGDI